VIPAPDDRIDPEQADAGWPLERQHGPVAWVMGPEPAGPPSALMLAIEADDQAAIDAALATEIAAIPEIEPLSEAELAELLREAERRPPQGRGW
jgi:hypothetical protein